MKKKTQRLLLSALFTFYTVSVFAQGNPLYIPPVLNGPIYNLNMQNGTRSFRPGVNSATRGFNGNILGPTLILQAGQNVAMNVHNGIGEETTVHWHGLHVSPENDGGPHSVIDPNENWTPIFKVMNHAATYWYHPHLHGQTDKHVSQGLAGMLIVKDSAESSYNLPRTYGVDDFPVIVQTKSIDAAGTIHPFTYQDSIIMVNATREPLVTVPRQLVRLRLLNGSSHRVFRFGLTSDSGFYQIASDDGMLSNAAWMTRLELSPGERAEILVNFSNYTPGSCISLRS